MGGDARERVAARDPPQGLEGGGAQELVVEQREEGGSRPRVADLPQGMEGRVLQPRLAAQSLDEARDGLAKAGADELVFYDGIGKLDELAARNAI